MPFPSPEDLPDPGIEPAFLLSPALADGFFITAPTGEAKKKFNITKKKKRYWVGSGC